MELHTIHPYIDPDEGVVGYEARTPAGAMYYTTASFSDMLQNLHRQGITRALFLDTGNPYIINFQPLEPGALL